MVLTITFVFRLVCRVCERKRGPRSADWCQKVRDQRQNQSTSEYYDGRFFGTFLRFALNVCGDRGELVTMSPSDSNVIANSEREITYVNTTDYT